MSSSRRSLSRSADDDFTNSQSTKPKNSCPNSPPPPSTTSLGKRRRAMPVRYGVFTNFLEKKRSPTRPDMVVQDSSSKNLCSQENSTAKCAETRVESSPAMVRAGELQASLGSEHPSCIKVMVKAHVGTGYWMSFPQWFGKSYLPKKDCDMEIEDENGEIYHFRYITYKCGLSAGWKKFAVDHNLHEDDVLVFQLVEACKLKVYIIRANDLNVNDANSLPNLEARTEQKTPGTITPSSPTKKSKTSKSLPLLVQKNHKSSTSPSLINDQPIEQSGNDSEEFGSEVLDGSRPSILDCTYQDFHIMVGGVCIDSELPDDVKMDYYKLCIARKELLHDTLPENLFYKLVAGMIGETVSVANEIKNCKLTTTKEEFEEWDNSLNSFSLLGMKVEFLRDRIHILSKRVFESEGRLYIEKYMDTKKEQQLIEVEIENVTEKLMKLEEASRKLKGTIDGLKQKVESHKAKFQEEVNLPW